jgi:hypothetical protein
MKDIVDKAEQDKNTVKNPVDYSASRFRKYKYVLPSGRILKILVDDESEFTGSVARA